MTRFLSLILFSCLFIGLVFPIALVNAEEELKFFFSDIYVLEDGSIIVTEQIKVNCEGKDIKHGIYRDLPVIYKSHYGLKLDSELEILDVQIDGIKSAYHTKSISSSYIRIYIGSKSRFISKGIHDFLLTYKMKGMISFFKEFDELYWNVTGDNWKFPIKKARVRITLPAKTNFIHYATYTGKVGSTTSMARLISDQDGQIEFETTATLWPSQGFTVAVAWPKGVIKEPSGLQKFYKTVKDNIFFLSGVLFIFLAISYYITVWAKHGKDPELGTIVPIYSPPEGISPHSARFIRKMGWDDKIFAVALIDMAVKGAIIFKEDDGDIILKRKNNVPKEPLVDGERKIFNMLLSATKELILDKSNAAKIISAKDGLKEVLKKKYEKIYFLTNTKYLIGGIFLSVLGLLCIALSGQDKFGGVFITLWLTIWSSISVSLLIKGIKLLKSKKFGTFLFSLPFNAFIVAGCFFYVNFVNTVGLILWAIIVITNFLFFHLMKAPTEKGLALLRSLEGFRMFLKTAEAKRLEALTPNDKLPELFERYLPWAMALDVENTWAEKFEALLREKGQDYPYTPTWWSGSHFYSYSAIPSSIGSSLSSAIAVATAPTSSGSGGGGSAGGGGGGGGGGGW